MYNIALLSAVTEKRVSVAEAHKNIIRSLQLSDHNFIADMLDIID